MEVMQARAVVVQLDLINLSCKAMDQLLVAVAIGSVPPLLALARPLAQPDRVEVGDVLEGGAEQRERAARARRPQLVRVDESRDELEL